MLIGPGETQRPGLRRNRVEGQDRIGGNAWMEGRGKDLFAIGTGFKNTLFPARS